jgi:hypothetical protein
MAELLFEAQQDGVFYRVIRGNGRHLLIQEELGGCRRSYRISRQEYERLFTANEAERVKLAKDIYHQARLRRKARKRAIGGNGSDELVPAL